jgi:hypothetical protein
MVYMAPPQAMGLHAEPEQPFHPDVLDPQRCVWQFAGDKGKGCPYRKGRHRQQVTKLVDKDFLSRASQTNKKNACSAGANTIG